MIITRRFFYVLAILILASGTQNIHAQKIQSQAATFNNGDRVCFIGNSITHGGLYHSLVYLFYLTRFPERRIDVFNCGISGDNVGGTLKRFNNDIAIHHPSVATIKLGTNDINRSWYVNSTPEKEAEKLKADVLYKSNNKVDAITGPTQPSIYEYVVRNAVYTCYTLWHMVYGPARKNILSILEERVDKDYLHKVFESKEPQYQIWAIDFIAKHPEYHSGFNPAIINMVKSSDRDLAQKAISYFTSGHLKDAAIQVEMARAAGETTTQSKFEIIWKFAALQEVCNDAILIFLKLYENQQINAGLMGYVCKLIHSDNLEDTRIVKKLKELSKDKNLYVSNMVQKLLL